MSDTINVNKGECISLQMVWKDETGVPIDLTDKVIAIVEAKPAAMLSGAIDIDPGESGIVTVHFPLEVATALLAGRANWFRVGLTSDDGHNNTTPVIWINVK